MKHRTPTVKGILFSWFLVLCFIIACVFFFTSRAHCQTLTLTNADLGKKINRPPAGPEVYAMLKAHEYQPVPICTDCNGPYIASTGATQPTAGPWDWPVERPARRLDGTLIDSPPIVYGAPWWWNQRGFVLRSGVSERERTRVVPRRGRR